MERIIQRPWSAVFGLTLFFGGLFGMPTPVSVVAQDKTDVERAKALQRELNLNHDEMIKLLQSNREEIRRAMARLQAPGPLRPPVVSQHAIPVARLDLAR